MEPERPIEKLLRAFSKRRREQARQFELHPATRNLLQGEVTRLLGEKARRQQSSFIRLWPRFAYGFGLLAVVGIVTYFIWLSPSGTEPTQYAQAPAEGTYPTPSPAAAPSMAPASADSYFQESKSSSLVAAAPPTAVGSRDDSKAPSPLADVPALKDSASTASVLATAPPAATAATEPARVMTFGVSGAQTNMLALSERQAVLRNTKALATAQTKAKAEMAQNANVQEDLTKSELDKASSFTTAYVSTNAGEDRKVTIAARRAETPSQPVLRSFRLQRTGDSIEITDNDGSVYRGNVVPLQDAVGIRARSIAKDVSATAKPRAPGNEAWAQPVSFSVSGTNVTLNTNVFFSGTFTPATSATSFGLSVNTAPGAVGGAAPAAKAELPGAANAILPPINGKLKIGSTNQSGIPINATPAGP